MEKNEKKKKEEIKEQIRKETGFLINNLNLKNAKKEIEEFIYVMADSYNKCWTTISYLEEIDIDCSACLKNNKRMEIVNNAINIIDSIFQDEETDYSEALDGIIKLAISDSMFCEILKEDLPILEEIREMIKTRKDAKFDGTPIYIELTEFYFDYHYDGNMSKFIDELNSAIKEIFNNESIIKNCFRTKGGTKDD